MKKINVFKAIVSSPFASESLRVDDLRLPFGESFCCYLVEIECGSEKQEFFTDLINGLCSELLPRAYFYGYKVTLNPKPIKVAASYLHLYQGDFRQFSLI